MTLTRVNTNGITDGTIVDADVSGSAAIAGTKVSPDFGSQNRTSTGTSTAASFIPTGSSVPANGVYLPGANALGLSTNSTERIRVTSGGLVGIGTTSPNAALDVLTGVNAGVVIRQKSSSPWNSGEYTQIGLGVTGANAIIRCEQTDSSAGSFATALTFFTTNTSNALSERCRLTSSGQFLVGTSTARSNTFSGSVSQTFQIEGNTDTGRGAAIFSTVNGQPGGYLLLGHSKDGTIGGNALITNGDDLGLISFQGNDGSKFVEGARISAIVDGTSGVSDLPTRLSFSTTADGASSPTERMRIRSDGNIGFFNTPGIYPNTDNAAGCGFTGFRWSAVWAATGTIQTSDQRAKTEITNASLGSAFIKSLRPVSYKWVEGGKRDTGERDEDGNYIYKSVPGERTHWGFIAQEVKEAIDAAGVDFGGWVLTDKDDPDSQQALRYDQFIAPLTKALQEALTEIDVLKAKVAALEAA